MKTLRFFRRLQWKLTLSYAIVTAGTVMLLAMLLLAVAAFLATHGSDNLTGSYYWTKTGFQDNVPYLLNDPPALQTWLDRVQAEGFIDSDFRFYTVRETMSQARTLMTGAPIFVLDPQLNIIAAAPLKDAAIIGKPYEKYAPAGYQIAAMQEAVLTGDKNYPAQSMMHPDGTYLAAFPLRTSDTDPVAAIVVYQAKPLRSYVPPNLDLYLTFFLVTMGIMFIVSVPVGAVFGWLASRGLRERLSALSAASKTWSTGDFTPKLRGKTGDEVDELTGNLNNMAEQLQILIHSRDELSRLEERNRLARDLHDTVKQQTYAARMQLTAAKNLLLSSPQAAAEHLEAALQLNRESQQELRLIIEELRPAALEGKGLAQALREYANRWQEHTGIRVETMISGERLLPLEVEQVLYRVVQEALSNVARHAEAETVRLNLEVTARRVRLSVADDGRGFEPDAVSRQSLGLTSMKTRLAEIGGTLTVESTLGAGTRLLAEVRSEVEHQDQHRGEPEAFPQPERSSQ